MNRGRIGALALGWVLLSGLSARAQQPFAYGEFGYGPNGLGYSGFGYTVPGPLGPGYYPGLYLPPYDDGYSPYYSPIFNSLNAMPGPDPQARPIFSGEPPLARARDRLLARFHKPKGKEVP